MKTTGSARAALVGVHDDSDKGTKPHLVGSAAVILVRDVVRSEAYYREKLGFDRGRLYGQPPDFCIQSRDGCTVMLAASPLVTPHWQVVRSMWTAYFWVDDARSLYQEMIERGAVIDYELGVKLYGVLEFGVQDLDGHDLGFGEVVG